MTAFRPVFTRRLAERLQNGQVFNLTAARGQGSTRLMKDLAEALPQALYLDLADPDLKPEGIWSQATEAEANSWAEVLPIWRQQDVPPVLLFDHLDHVANPTLFGKAFFDALQPVWVSPRLGMLFATERPLQELGFDFSWPETEVVALPPLGFKRIKEELMRHFPELKNWTPIATPIFSHPQPYDFMQFAITRMEEEQDMLETPIDNWMPQILEAYNRMHDLDVQPVRPKEGSWWQRLRSKTK
jgi:hypothetical protein